MTQILYDKYKHVSGKRTSSQRTMFLDMVNNPEKYKGYIVYLTEVDEDELYKPFEKFGTFYMNEGGSWQMTDFHSQTFNFEE